MKIYEIKGLDGAVVDSFKVPSDCSEITLKNFVDYESKLKKLPEWVSQLNSETIKDLSVLEWSQLQMYVAELLGILTGKGLEKVLNLEVDQNGLIAIWLDLHSIVSTYEPKEISSFIYKGFEFVVPERAIARLTGNKLHPRLTIAEGILSLQYEHLYSKKELYENGGFYWKLLSIISILCRQQDEILPFSDDELIRFTDERIDFFKELTLDIALNVWFFFVKWSKHTKMTLLQDMLLFNSINLHRQR